jgi:hypothetical protein
MRLEVRSGGVLVNAFFILYVQLNHWLLGKISVVAHPLKAIENLQFIIFNFGLIGRLP